MYSSDAALAVDCVECAEVYSGKGGVGSSGLQAGSEKYIKALLTFRGDDFPKIYDVEELLALAGLSDRVGITVEEQRLLTDYATVTRCPGDYEPVTVTEARRAVSLARRVRAAVLKELRRDARGQE
jgi:HEPN domain-containing protein